MARAEADGYRMVRRALRDCRGRVSIAEVVFSSDDETRRRYSPPALTLVSRSNEEKDTINHQCDNEVFNTDEWVPLQVKAGDLITLPEGIHHRFTADKKDRIHATRLFIGQPVWAPFNRPCEEHESRAKHVREFLEETKMEE